MADREFIDLFVRLKGEIKKLDKLAEKGLKVKVNLEFNKAQGGGFSKLQKLKDNGLNIKVRLNLVGKGYQRILALQKGLTIPIKFQGGGGGTAQQRAASRRNLNFTDVRAFSRSGVGFSRPSQTSRLGSRGNQGSLDDFADFILSGRAPTRRTVRSFTRGSVGSIAGSTAISTGSQSGSLSKFFSKSDLNEIKSKVVQNITGIPTTRSASRATIRRLGNNVVSFGSQKGSLDKFFSAKDIKEIKNQVVQKVVGGPRSTTTPGGARGFDSKAFRDRQRLLRAQEEFDLASPIFGSQRSQRDRIAFENNLNPGQLRSPRRRGIAKVTRGLINPRRLANRESARELGFAALFGGNAGREFGLPGEALSTLGAVSGAAIGGSIAPGGALIGTVVAERTIESLFRVIASLTEKFKEAVEAGLQFEESIVGISSVLQATSVASGAGGGELSVGSQLGVQTQRARDIQQLARKRLLPLGIGGRSEGALVSGIITGFAQQGVQLTPEQAATLAERIGGAVQAQRPDLLNNINRLRLEIEDSISNPGRITALTPVLRAFAPNLARATSGEEAVKLTQGLSAFPGALTENTESAVIALRKFNAEIENFKVIFGSELLQTITPGIQALGNVLKDEAIQDNLKTLARELGVVFNVVAKGLANLLNSLKGLFKFFGGGAQATGTLAGASGGAAIGGLGGALGGLALGGPLGALAGGVGGSLFSGALGGLFGFTTGNAVQPFISNIAENDRLSRAAKVRQRRNAKIRPTAQSSIELFNRVGSLDALTLAESFIPQLNKDQRLNANIDAAGLRASAIGSERSRRGGTFDTFLASGAFGKATSNLSFDNQLLTTQKELVTLREKELKIAQEQVSESPSSQAAIKKQIEAEQNLRVARDQLSVTTVQAAQSTRALFAAIGQRTSQTLSGINQGTFSGQRAALNVESQAIAAERGLISQSNLSGAEQALRNAQLNVRGQNLANKQELQPINEQVSLVNVAKAVSDYQFNQENVNQELQSYKDALSRATLTLDDFNASGELRDALDSQKRVQAARSALASGSSSTGLAGPLSIEELAAARGDVSAQRAIERRVNEARFNQVARETDPDRRRKEDARTRRGLVRNQVNAQQNLENFPLNFLSRQLGLGKQITQFGQQTKNGVFSKTGNIFSDINTISSSLPSISDSLKQLIGKAGGTILGKISEEDKKRTGAEIFQALSGTGELFEKTKFTKSDGTQIFGDNTDTFGSKFDTSDAFGDAGFSPFKILDDGSRSKLRSTIKKQSTFPDISPLKQAANENVGANIVAALAKLEGAIANTPQANGQQFNQALNNTFSGGHR